MNGDIDVMSLVTQFSQFISSLVNTTQSYQSMNGDIDAYVVSLYCRYYYDDDDDDDDDQRYYYYDGRFRVQDLGFSLCIAVQGLGLRVQSEQMLCIAVQGLGFRVYKCFCIAFRVRVCILRNANIIFLSHIFVEQVYLSEAATQYETRNCLSSFMNFF